jgi:hypothetical protein
MNGDKPGAIRLTRREAINIGLGTLLSTAVAVPGTAAAGAMERRVLGRTGLEDPSLVGWWKLDETSGTTIHDSSGNGKHGSLVDGPTWTSGKINGALHFANTLLTNEHVRIPNADAVRSVVHSGQYSILCWAFPERVPDQDPGNTGEGLVFADYRGLSWNMSQRFFMGYYAGSGENRWAKSHVHSPGKWYHLAGTVDSSQGTTKSYVNRKHEGTAYFTAGETDTGTGNTLLLGIGNPNYPSGQTGLMAFQGAGQVGLAATGSGPVIRQARCWPIQSLWRSCSI